MFRTEIHPKPSDWKINLSHSVFSMGSCFSIHIGELLHRYKFKTLTNPFGTIYNPISLFQLIEFSLKNERPEDWSFLHHQGVYRNYHFHSDLSAINEDEFHLRIDNTFEVVKNFLVMTDVLLITFGSAIVYKLKSDGHVVANCHKIPGRNFDKRMLRTGDIIEDFNRIYGLIKRYNPGVRLILTVSPVRHLKETLELNSASKATLRVACEELKNNFQDVAYFPSYEMMIDDLRDYRFYKEDMLHPTEQTVKYIWDKFSHCYFDIETLAFTNEWEKIRKSIYHRPFYPGSPEHLSFVKKTIEKIEGYKEIADVTEELEILRNQIELH